MKVYRFDCNVHSAPAYSCSVPGDNTGHFVPASKVAQMLNDWANMCRRTLAEGPHQAAATQMFAVSNQLLTTIIRAAQETASADLPQAPSTCDIIITFGDATILGARMANAIYAYFRDKENDGTFIKVRDEWIPAQKASILVLLALVLPNREICLRCTPETAAEVRQTISPHLVDKKPC